MPRTYELTWQPGAGSRPGRWRKKYQRKVYYLPGGRGKSDRDGYLAALGEWERLKVEIDAQTPKRHQAAYERALETWENVLAWSRTNGELEMAAIAVVKQGHLRRALSAAKPRPVRLEDTFEGQFELSVRDPGRHKFNAEIGAAVEAAHQGYEPDLDTESGRTFDAARQAYQAAGEKLAEDFGTEGPGRTVIPSGLNMDAGDPLKIEKEVWQDRLQVMERSAQTVDQTLHAHAETFLAGRKAAADAGEISPGRYSNLHLYVTEFVEWRGRKSVVAEINGKTLSAYHVEVLHRSESKGWSSRTAKDRFDAAKHFIRWLWHVDAIPTLPRNMDSRSGGPKIGKSSPAAVVVFEKAEITRLLKEASERTELYILLMLNCGMTQKDIADLHQAEVDWQSGRITRKRSKTRHFASVPEVSYVLWPRTQSLLRKHRNVAGEGPVLLNAGGGPLRYEEAHADGKLTKNDNIRTAFGRLQRKTGIAKPLKSLKKTSATLIRGHAKYASLESLFLGHAPKTMSDKHYTRPPQKMLDDAIQWLANEYGLADRPA